MDVREFRSWMYNRFLPSKKDYTQEFVVGVHQFIEYVKTTSQYEIDGETRCPCKKCENRKYLKLDNVHEHILRFGFVANYWYWTSHGEQRMADYRIPTRVGRTSDVPCNEPVCNNYDNMVFDQMMGQNVRDLPSISNTSNFVREEHPNTHAQQFYDMLEAARRPLCSCSDAHTELSIGVQMMSIKADYNMSQGCFNRIAELIKSSHESENCVPENYYETKKLLRGLGLTSVKIDCCTNGCMLYYKNDTSLTECKFCTHPRFKPRRGRNAKGNFIPYKRMHYLPITPRLQRLYASMKSAEHMRWHAECVRESGVLIHPSDGMAWKHFDAKNPDFASEPRNVRLGLCADGFNLFNQFGAAYSCWPVIVTPYNLPPELCMTTPYMFLTCLIPGPNNPKSRIDVYLQPLIAELQSLWSEGVEAYDISRKQNFQMRAALMWTINDFPAYGMLSGWTTAGRLSCPLCMDNTKSFRLVYSGKTTWFDCHRQFLPCDHPFRRNQTAFYKDRIETSDPPNRKSGEELWDQVRTIPKIADVPLHHNKIGGYGSRHNWVKQSIFWDLPYWKDHLVRHNLDVMHIEKNVFDNVINTVMDVKEKTKDNEKSRMDLPSHCHRQELHMKTVSNGKVLKPKACFTLNDKDKNDLCDWILQLRMPDGYASNLSQCVDKAGRRLHGMKSHDCHIFMQRLLPFALISGLPPTVYESLTELSQFFRDLCATELRVEDLQKMDVNIPLLICKLERIFPPSFFDVMEHLPVHLPYEALMCGPVHYRWMYPFERFLHELKGTVKNRSRVEGSICEAYIVKEISFFFAYYFEFHVQSRSTRKRRNETYVCPEKPPQTMSIFTQAGRASGKCTSRWLSDSELKAASLHVLTQCDEVVHFIELYKASLLFQYPHLDEITVQKSFDEHFLWWFQKHVHDPANSIESPYIKDLAWGPFRQVETWARYFVNGYVFHTEGYGLHKSTYNCGVCVKREHSSEFYGILKEVIQLRYPGAGDKRVVLFNCEWFDSVSHRGIRLNEEFGHIELKVTEKYPKYDPFILAQHASQVYYIPHPGKKRDKINWRFVLKTRPRSGVDRTHIIHTAFQEAITNVRVIRDVDDDIANLVDANEIYEEVNIEHLSISVSNEYVDEDDVDEEESTDDDTNSEAGEDGEDEESEDDA